MSTKMLRYRMIENGGQVFKIDSIKLDIGSKTFLHMHTGLTEIIKNGT